MSLTIRLSVVLMPFDGGKKKKMVPSSPRSLLVPKAIHLLFHASLIEYQIYVLILKLNIKHQKSSTILCCFVC